MKEIVFLLEERSAQVMLEGLIPRLINNPPSARYVTFEGKRDLEANLVKKLRGYRNPDAKFIVVRDLDSHPDCRSLKSRLIRLCEQSGKTDFLIRIFCCELETIYMADLAAVEKGLAVSGIARRQGERKFRNPDRVTSPSHELTNLTGGQYQKVNGSRAIAPHLDLENTRSPSFVALVEGIQRLCA